MSEFPNDTEAINPLDVIRSNRGISELILHFNNMILDNKRESIRLLNDDKLCFGSLFNLRDLILKHGLYRYLIPRNIYALSFIERVLCDGKSKSRNLGLRYTEELHSVLRWIIDSDIKDPGYDDIIDSAAVILSRIYKDKSLSRKLTDILFERNRRGAYTYDLIWAAYETCDPEVLVAVSERLMSSDKKDNELSNRLLRFVPSDPGMALNIQNQQKASWIKKNHDFLYYTGETLHQSCNPKPFAVSTDAKYLGKRLTHEKSEFLEPLTGKEYKQLTHFSTLDDSTKELLAECSSILINSNMDIWKKWISSPVSEQILHAARMRGGV